MSKIGKLPIEFSEKVTVTQDGQKLVVKGPLGELSYITPRELAITIEDRTIIVKPNRTNKRSKELWGLWRTLIANAVVGVETGFQKQLELVGVGYRVQQKGTAIELEVGYSHKIDFEPMEGVTLETDKGIITVSGIDKQKVGQTAAEIRATRKPEPYKGKGVRYVGEYVKLKAGKTAKASL